MLLYDRGAEVALDNAEGGEERFLKKKCCPGQQVAVAVAVPFYIWMAYDELEYVLKYGNRIGFHLTSYQLTSHTCLCILMLPPPYLNLWKQLESACEK